MTVLLFALEKFDLNIELHLMYLLRNMLLSYARVWQTSYYHYYWSNNMFTAAVCGACTYVKQHGVPTYSTEWSMVMETAQCHFRFSDYFERATNAYNTEFGLATEFGYWVRYWVRLGYWAGWLVEWLAISFLRSICEWSQSFVCIEYIKKIQAQVYLSSFVHVCCCTARARSASNARFLCFSKFLFSFFALYPRSDLIY